jgi:hypothetical protein
MMSILQSFAPESPRQAGASRRRANFPTNAVHIKPGWWRFSPNAMTPPRAETKGRVKRRN